jgi:hypothetical protein
MADFRESLTPDRLAPHVWRSGRSRRRWPRRLGRSLMIALATATILVVLGYAWLTDPQRIRQIAQDRLSEWVNADVTIGSASLSIFEGVELREVRIDTRDVGTRRPFLNTSSIRATFSPWALLVGKLRDVKLVVSEPDVFLIEDLDQRRWNFNDLIRRRPGKHAGPTTDRSSLSPPQLPTVLLRGMKLHRAETTGPRLRELAAYQLEGQLVPDPVAAAYSFHLQSRTEDGSPSPSISGTFSLANQSIDSTLRDVRLEQLDSLLPEQVRRFWSDLQIAGAINVPTLRVDGTSFEIAVDVDDVAMSVNALAYASPAEADMLRLAPDLADAILKQIPNPHGLIATLNQFRLRASPLPLRDVNARFRFTNDAIQIESLSAMVDQMPINVSGTIGGYSPDSPLRVSVRSPEGGVFVPPDLPYINTFPPAIREVYYRFRPEGQCKLAVDVVREAAGGSVPTVTGEIEFARAQFTFENFTYTVYDASGKLLIDRDPATGEQRLTIIRIGGRGPAGGVNEDARLEITGVIQPLEKDSGVDVTINANRIESEPSLIDALPSNVRNVINAFDPDRQGPIVPRFAGNVVCHVLRPPGPISNWSYDTDVTITDGFGQLRGFPYPLRNFQADLRIRTGKVHIDRIRFGQDNAWCEINGLSEWPSSNNDSKLPVRKGGFGSSTVTRLDVRAAGFPINDDLLLALPDNAENAVRRIGLNGLLDAKGSLQLIAFDEDVNYDLAMTLRDGTIAPDDWKTRLTEVSAAGTIRPGRLIVEQLTARRDQSDVRADARVNWADGRTDTRLSVSAKALAVDDSLRDSLPPAARNAWEAVRPAGMIDVDAEVTAFEGSVGWQVGITPRAASAMPTFFPAPLSDIEGKLVIKPGIVLIDRLSARGFGGTLRTSGTGTLYDDKDDWRLAIDTRDIQLGEPLFNALPADLGKMLANASLAGTADIDVKQFDWQTDHKTQTSDLRFDVATTFKQADADLGVKLSGCAGLLQLSGRVVDGSPVDLSGRAVLESFQMFGHAGINGATTIESGKNGAAILVKDIRAGFADGEIAGAIAFDRSKKDSTRYSAEIMLRNADLSKFIATAATAASGRLSASLAVEGTWADPAAGVAPARRGRGDISVSGKQIVQLPAIVGLTQIVSLQLPFAGGFDDASTRYIVDGQRVTLEDVSLRSQQMAIRGGGTFDLAERTVNLDFFTATEGQRLPLLSDLIDATRRELLRIKVRGTLGEPQISAGSLETITGTVKEVLGEASDK